MLIGVVCRCKKIIPSAYAAYKILTNLEHHHSMLSTKGWYLRIHGYQLLKVKKIFYPCEMHVIYYITLNLDLRGITCMTEGVLGC